jgi:DivIVA domain-containing protein
MALTPEDIHNKEFTRAFRGYNELEVDAFLDELEVEVSAMVTENVDLRERLSTAAATPPAPVQAAPSESEEMIRRTLLLAQRTSDETIAAAQAEAERLVTSARESAQAQTAQAQAQAAAAVSDLDRRRRELEAQIEGLRAFEREYRARLKAYLETQLRDLDTRGGTTSVAGAGAGSAGSSGGPLFQPVSGVAGPPAEPPGEHDDGVPRPAP